MTVQLDLEEACLQLFSLNGLKCHLTDFSRAASCRNSETKGASIPWELAQHPVSGRSQHLLYEVLTFLCSECGMGDPDSPSMGPSVKVFFLLYFKDIYLHRFCKTLSPWFSPSFPAASFTLISNR